MKDETKTKQQLIAEIGELRRQVADMEAAEARQRQREEALRESEMRFRTVADFTYDWEYWRGPEGNLIYVSPSCERITGYRPHEFQDDPALMEAIVHPDDRARVAEHMRQEILNHSARAIEFRILTRSGEQRWIGHVCQPVRDADGVWQGRRASNRDITQRKQAEESLETLRDQLEELVRERTAELEELSDQMVAERSLLRTVIDNLPDSIYAKDARSRFLVGNAAVATLMGAATPDDLLGKTDFDFYPPELASKFRADEEAVVRTGQPAANIEEPVLDPQGNTHWLLTTKVPLRDSQGNVIGLVGIGRDITERKQTEETLQKSQANLSQAQQIAHLGSWAMNLETSDLDWSDESYRIFGLSPTGIGMTQERFFDYVYPEDKEAVLKVTEDALNNNKPFDIEHRIVRPDGETRFVLEQAEVIFDESGRPLEMIGTVQDITERKQAEEALQESEELFRTVFEQAGVGVARTAPDGRFLSVNQRYCDIVGYSQAEMLEKSFQDITHTDDADDNVDRFRQLVAGKTDSYSLEKRYLHKDGSVVWVTLTTSLVRDPSDAPKYCIAIIEDITERKQAEVALQESQERLRVMGTSAHDAILMIDHEGNTSYWNPAAQKMFGYAAEEALGKNLHRLLVPPRFHKAHFEAFPQFQATGTGNAIGKTLELSAVRKDGTEIPVEFSLSAVKVKDRWNAIGIIRDISERKQAEETLHASEAKYRELVENANSIILRMDAEGSVTFFNEFAQRFFGYTQEEILGKSVVGTIIPATDSSGQDLTGIIEDIIRSSDGLVVNENENVRRDGERVWVTWTNKTFLDDEGRISEILCIGTDISERKQAEEALSDANVQLEEATERANQMTIVAEAADRAKSEFLASMSHEIRTPMNGIIGMTELALGTELTPVQREYLTAISSSAEALLGLLNDILDFSKIEAGQLDIEEVPFDLRPTIEQVADVTAHRAAQKGLELMFHLHPDVPEDLTGDPLRLRQVLVNLIGNAIKFTEQGEVVVEVKCATAPAQSRGWH